MRLPRAWASLMLVSCLTAFARELDPRGALPAAAPTSTTAISSQGKSSATSGNGTPSTTPKSTASVGSSTSVNSKITSVTSQQHVTPTTSHSTATIIPTHPKNATDTDALPLKPVITPALGVAGVILILAGLALGLIGIKHKIIQTFLSTALLTSLAVTVLIVYLMSPPISDAIQGGFFVAALVTGVIFGAISLIFKEVTEGLGCLLGGFCLAMWFLVLSPGGLIKSTTGRAIMIAVFCVVGWSFSFSHYTRNQGLIVASSFTGATAAIIGIDCFSRAGLTQFWLYLWNLNGNIFPIGTDTFPITRGIRVEIAVIIILFLLGLMSQFKIWKIVKERREKASVDRLRELESRDQHDQNAGREIEARNEEDLKRWEAQYGDKGPTVTHTDSGLGSSVASLNKRSTSVTEHQYNTIEMDDMQSKRGSKNEPRTSVTAVPMATEDDWAQERAAWGSSQQNLINPESYGRRSQASLAPSQHNASETMEPLSEEDEQGYEDSDRPPIPQVVPLPFSPPVESDQDDKSDAGSVGTKVTVGQTVSERRGMRLSLSSLRKHMRQQRTSVPQIEEDRASSIAAIADGESDDDLPPEGRRSEMLPPLEQVPSKGGLTPQSEEAPSSRPLSYIGSAAPENPVEENDDEELVRASQIIQAPPPPPPAEVSPATSKPESQSTIASRRKSKSIKSLRSSWDGAPPETEIDGEPSVVGSLSGRLPEKLSKVALAYRTNEWAKHIADADQPTDDQPESHSPGIQVDRAFAEEASKPVDPAGLVGTIPEEPTFVPRKTSKTTKPETNPYRNSKQSGMEAQASRRSSAAIATPVYAFQREVEQPALRRETSTSSMVNAPKLQTRASQRVSSLPLMAQEALVESPVEEDVRPPMPAIRNFSTPLVPSASTNNLLDERDNRLKRKTTSMSFNNLNRSTSHLNVVAADSASVRSVPAHESDRRSIKDRQADVSDEENMTLAERKNLIRQRRQSQPETYVPASPAGEPSSYVPAMPQQFTGATAGDRRISHRQSSMPLMQSTAATPSPGQLARSSTIMTGAQATSADKAIIYDSHQPQRGSKIDTIKQANMLTQWRASLVPESNIASGANVTGSGKPAPGGTAENRQAAEQARDSMLAQKQWAAFNKQKSAEESSRRQSMREQAMRSGQMQGAHQDVLRKMQAQANRNASLAEQ